MAIFVGLWIFQKCWFFWLYYYRMWYCKKKYMVINTVNKLECFNFIFLDLVHYVSNFTYCVFQREIPTKTPIAMAILRTGTEIETETETETERPWRRRRQKPRHRIRRSGPQCRPRPRRQLRSIPGRGYQSLWYRVWFWIRDETWRK